MLILEGADMLGKTTFCRALMDTHPALNHRKCGLPEADLVGSEPWRQMIDAGTVCDRFAMSEFIYGLVCRGKSNLLPGEWKNLHEEMWLRGAKWLVWVCHPSEYLHILEQRYDARREAFTIEQCAKVNQAYWDLVQAGHWCGYDLPNSVTPVLVQASRAAISQQWPASIAADWERQYGERNLIEQNPGAPWRQ